MMNGGSDTESEGSDIDYQYNTRTINKRTPADPDLPFSNQLPPEKTIAAGYEDRVNERYSQEKSDKESSVDDGDDCDEDFTNEAVENARILTGNEPEHVSQKLGASVLWSYFKVTEMVTFFNSKGGTKKKNSLIKCDVTKSCPFTTTEAKRNTSTSNLRNHLIKKHGIKKDDLKEGASKKKALARLAKNSIQKSLIRSMKISKTQRLSDAIVSLFKSHPLPFTLVESPHFQALFRILDTNLPIADRVTLANRILDQGNEMQEKIKKLLSSDEVLNIHLSTDLWRSPGDRSHYIAVIISFVDQRFEFNEILHTFAKFNIQHTGANLANGVFSLLEEYQILHKLTGVTTDGAANNVSMMHELEKLYEEYKLDHGKDSITGLARLFTRSDWAHCLSHIIHLLVTTTLRSYREFQEVLPKVRKVASIIRLSDTYRGKFEEICNYCNMRFSRPPGEVQIRWNSSYELLNWCIIFRGPLNIFLRDNYVNANEKIKEQFRFLGSTAPFGEVLPSDTDLCLSKSEWNLVILMRGILETFYQFTCRFNKCQSVSSDALNALFYIDEFLKDIKESETVEQTKVFFERHKIKSTISVIPEGLRKAVNMACGKLEKYISDADRMDAIYLSNVLDPRYKRNIIESNLLQRDARNILQMCLNKVVKMNEILEEVFGEDSDMHTRDQETRKLGDSDIEDEFNNRVMNCLGSRDERIVDFCYSRGSIAAEWDLYLNAERERSFRGFNVLQYWKRERK